MTEDLALPSSASDLDSAPSDAIEIAYIKNPVFNRERLSPLEALQAIGLLSAALQCDEYRTTLANRRLDDANGG